MIPYNLRKRTDRRPMVDMRQVSGEGGLSCVCCCSRSLLLLRLSFLQLVLLWASDFSAMVFLILWWSRGSGFPFWRGVLVWWAGRFSALVISFFNLQKTKLLAFFKLEYIDSFFSFWNRFGPIRRLYHVMINSNIIDSPLFQNLTSFPELNQYKC